MEYKTIHKEDWEVNIRSDMWNQMNSFQLGTQLELILDKISLLRQLSSNPITLNLINALNMAMDDVNMLITNLHSKPHVTESSIDQ